MVWGPIQRLRREWDERFLKAIARIERETHEHDRCGGCGRVFLGHPFEDFEECVRKVLLLD